MATVTARVGAPETPYTRTYGDNRMIPVQATGRMMETYVNNIVTAYGRATVSQRLAGERWYVTANELAQMLTGGNARQGAGVIAALSANKSWPENQKLASRAFASGKASGHVVDAIRKATRIMGGDDPEHVLPMHSKTGHFFRCIADPADTDAICIDRHAHDIAAGEIYGNRDRGLSSKGRYNTLAHAYRTAAARLGVLPMVVQAVTWVAHIESKSNPLAFGHTLSAV